MAQNKQNNSDHLFSTEQFEKMLKDFDPNRPESFELLLQYSSDRLRTLAHRLFFGENFLHRWAETDDILQNAVMDLCTTLRRETPTTKTGFFALASGIIRHRILDMARALRSQNADALYHHHTTAPTLDSDAPRLWEGMTDSPADTTLRLQEAIDALPDREKKVIELCYFGGIDTKTAAETLGISERRLREIRRSAQLQIHDDLLH